MVRSYIHEQDTGNVQMPNSSSHIHHIFVSFPRGVEDKLIWIRFRWLDNIPRGQRDLVIFWDIYK